MMMHRLSMLPFVGNSRLVLGISRGVGCLPRGMARFLWAMLVVMGANSGAAAFEPLVQDQRRHGPLFEGLAEPPPTSGGSLAGKALMGQPMAPFVFSGVLRIADVAFESNDDYLIGASPALINVQEGASAHFSGQIGSVPGSSQGLMKLGGGELMLSGSNTYTGNSSLLQGGLQVRSHSAWGWAALEAAIGTRLEYAPGVEVSAPLHITTLKVEDWAPQGSYDAVAAPEHADRLRWVVADGTAVHAGLLQGQAPFVKQGPGRLNISGDAMGYAGDALVEQGALAINEVFGGSVHVGKGARLEGAGMVAAARVLPGGILAPGNSIGSLMVGGDLRFDAGSRFEVDVDPSGAGDFVWVGGKAFLAGDVVALAQAGVWKPSTSYILLRADQGLDGRFDSVAVAGDFAFLEPALSYDADTVILVLARNETPLDEVAQTPDEDEVAKVVEKEDVADPGTPPLRDEVLLLDRASARNAFQQLSGSWSASLLSSLAEDSRFVRRAALDHAQVEGFWSRAFYSEAERAGKDGVPGETRSLQGVALGANRQLGQAWQAGAFLGVQQAGLRREVRMSEGSGGQASATLQSTYLGAIATGQWRPLRLTAGAAQSWHTVNSTRRVAFGGLDDSLGSRYRAHGTQVFAEAAWPVWLSLHSPPVRQGEEALSDQGGPHGRPASFLLEPFVGAAYVRLHMSGFDEQGGAAALSVQPARHAVRFFSLGVRAEHTFETDTGQARVRGQVAWRHAGGALQPAVHQSFRHSAGQQVFASHGLPIARNAWSLDVSVSGQISSQASLTLAYAGQFAKGLRDHGVQLGIRWAF